jgi:hypothetical protein
VAVDTRIRDAAGAARARAALRSAAATALIALAACQGSSAPVTTPTGPVPTPTTSVPATPAPTATTAPEATTGPTPTSPAAEARAVVDGLRAFAGDASRTLRVTFTGVSRHAADTLVVEGVLDVAGEDASVTATFEFPRGTGAVDYRRIGSRDWIRVDRGRWTALEVPEEAAMVDVFAGTHDGTRLQYLGPVAGTADRFEVELTGMILHPMLIPAGNLTDEKVTRTKVVLVTNEIGRPVSGTWTMRGQGRVSGQLQEIAIDLELTFSRLGEPVRIVAP